MNRRTAIISILALLIAGLAYSLWLYPALPDKIPIHWGWDGHVDGWGAKSWAAFLGPGVVALFLLLLVALPALSPPGFKLNAFSPTFHYVMALCAALFSFLHIVSLQAALRPELSFGRALIVGLLVFLAMMGNVLGKVRRNFWLGIRTPWALADEKVWNATHRLGGRLLFAMGLLGAVAVMLGAPPGVCFIALLASILVPVVYSLVLSKRLERQQEAG